MSIRALAQELYALERKVERLLHELEQTPPPRQDETGLEPLRAIADHDRLRATKG